MGELDNYQQWNVLPEALRKVLQGATEELTRGGVCWIENNVFKLKNGNFRAECDLMANEYYDDFINEIYLLVNKSRMMNETKIVVKVHENYVQTCVRFFRGSGLDYVEYALTGGKIPLAVLQTENRTTLFTQVASVDATPFEVTRIYFPFFEGHLRVEFTFPDPNDHETFFVESTRYISPKNGAKEVAGAMRNEKLNRAILANLFTAIAEKDATKVKTVISALHAAL